MFRRLKNWCMSAASSAWGSTKNATAWVGNWWKGQEPIPFDSDLERETVLERETAEIRCARAMRRRETAKDPANAKDEELAEQEHSAREQERQDILKAEALDAKQTRPEDTDFVGLSFSGGGIRSATFNLGVLQSLAKRGYLSQIDYLSTVSGGGYIGSWLAAWIKRSGIRHVQDTLATNQELPGHASWRYLEPNPVRMLRNYSNYLAPRTGLISTDTWALLSVYCRNVLLNLALLVAAGAAFLLLPSLALSYSLHDGLDPLAWYNRAFVITALCLVISMAAVAYSFATFSAAVGPGFKFARSVVKHPGWYAVFPLLLASVCVTYLLVRDTGAGTLYDLVLRNRLSEMLSAALGTTGREDKLYWIATGAIWYTLIWAAGNLVGNFVEAVKSSWRVFFSGDSGPTPVTKSYVLPFLSTLASGGFGGYLLYLLHNFLNGFAGQGYSVVAARFTLGPPLMLFIFALVSILHVGLLGRNFPDAKREWLARFCAIMTLVACGWLLLFAFAFYGAIAFKFLFTSKWAHTAWGRVVQVIAAGGWAGTTLAGLIGASKGNGKTQKTATNGKPQKDTARTGGLLKLAPPVFILGLALLLAGGLDAFLAGRVHERVTSASISPSADDYRTMIQNAGDSRSASDFARQFSSLLASEVPPSARTALEETFQQHWKTARAYLDWREGNILYLLLSLAIAAFVLAWRLDVNEFSIHLLYRNRLVRCYLGASRGDKRRPQAFTGFDVKDDVLLARLTTKSSGPLEPSDGRREGERSYCGPYPILCTALNLVAGKNLAWQTRKARSFIYSPLYCGYDYYSTEPSSFWLRNHAYRQTSRFSDERGPYLGTAMAISGAAASPNMGYHSSPALTFLMGVFDVRLGWWAGNTRHRSAWTNPGPKSAAYLALELFGRTDDDKSFVYLSDGGHFENLGLYELVRRKCRYIIVSDAGCDEEMSFSDLGNAIEKCRRDLGAKIAINVRPLRRKGKENLSTAHFAYGTIDYQGDSTRGHLLYIKSSLTGKEPEDVQAYAAAHRPFPHDSTADQFFNEAQFESYRALGEHAFNSVVQAVEEALKLPPSLPEYIQNLFRALDVMGPQH